MVVLARLLVPSDFGLVAIALTISIFLGLVASLGLGGVFVVEQDLDDRAKGTYLTLFLAMGAGFALVMAAAAPAFASIFDDPRLDDVVLAMSVMVFFSGGLNWFYEALMQRELEFRNRFVAQMVQAVTYSVTGIVLAALGAGVLEPRHRPDRGRRGVRGRAPHAGALPRPACLRPGRRRARGAGGPRLPRPDGDRLRRAERRHPHRRPGARRRAPRLLLDGRAALRSCRAGSSPSRSPRSPSPASRACATAART